MKEQECKGQVPNSRAPRGLPCAEATLSAGAGGPRGRGTEGTGALEGTWGPWEGGALRGHGVPGREVTGGDMGALGGRGTRRDRGALGGWGTEGTGDPGAQLRVFLQPGAGCTGVFNF